MPAIRLTYGEGVSGRPLSSLDLNLLVALEALLAEANVTRAAERVGVSQPSMSASLRRLRRHFDDDLLRRSGNHYVLTPLAVRLAGRVGPATSAVRRVFDARDDFDPATQEREFTIAGSDYVAAVLGPVLTQMTARQAPGVTVRLQQQTPNMVLDAVAAVEGIDGLIIPHGFVDGLPYVELHEDPWVLLVAEDNPLLTHGSAGVGLTLDALGQLPWVVLYNLPTAYNPAQLQLRYTGLQPRVEVVVDTFLPIPHLIAGTRRVALYQAGLAAAVPPETGVRAVPCPYPVAPIREAFWWHPIHTEDPGHRWLRGVLADAASAIDGRPATYPPG